MGTTFNPSDKSAAIVLSNGNLTVSRSTATNANTAVRSVHSFTTGSKIYLEARIDAHSAFQFWVVIGFAAASEPLTAFPGDDALSVGFSIDEAAIIYDNDVIKDLVTGAVAGDVVSWAVDLANMRVWCRINAGNWNNSGTANPATNTGGASISGITLPLFVIVMNGQNGNVVTMRSTAASWTQSVPAGFTEVNPPSLNASSALTIAPFTGTATASSVTLHGSSALTIAPFAESFQTKVTIGASSAKPIGTFTNQFAGGRPALLLSSAFTLGAFTNLLRSSALVGVGSDRTIGAFGNVFAGELGLVPLLVRSAKSLGDFGSLFTAIVPGTPLPLALPDDVRAMWVEPNWADNYVVQFDYLTDIVTSRNGSEQRRALRRTPRKTLEFSLTPSGAEARSFDTIMRGWQSKRFAVPDYSRTVAIDSPLAAFTGVTTVDDPPSWLVPGALLFVTSGDGTGFETRFAIKVDGNQVYFETTTDRDWPAGSTLVAGRIGRFDPALATTRPTNTLANVKVNFSADPGSEPFVDPGVAPQTHRGVELFTLMPNWREDLQVTLQATVDQLDFNRGVIEYFEAQLFRQETFQATYTNVDSSEIEDLFAFFTRCRGRRGSFYAPTWREDLVLAAPFDNEDFQLLVEGRDVFDFLSGDTMTRDIAIIDTAFNVHPFRVASISLVGSNSLLDLTENLPDGLTPDDVLYISWLSRWRLGSDSITVNFITSSVAEFNLSMISLESDQ